MSSASASAQQTETQVLGTFLLSRASLQDVIPLRTFTELFPASARSNPQIKLLYRELQVARNRQLERVRKNIAIEARLGAKQRLEASAARRAQEGVVNDEESVGIELFGGAPSSLQRKLPLPELFESMSAAAEELDDEYRALDAECDAVLEELRAAIGDLSDLRYGKLASAGTDEQVVSQLQNLTDVCERALKPPGD